MFSITDSCGLHKIRFYRVKTNDSYVHLAKHHAQGTVHNSDHTLSSFRRVTNLVDHATLAVATVDVGRRTGKLELYDPSFNPDNELNLQSVLNGLIECEVGSVKVWRLADSKKDRFYAAPAQSINMCVTACSCFCLWKSSTDGF
jgi:hypothetical protein